jgi:uncharacterized membrane protein YczE
MDLSSLGTTRPRTRLTRRLVQLYAGLAAYGLSAALMVRSNLGVMPWDVLHQGISLHLGVDLGAVSIGVGVLVLLVWIPLREKIGLGTVSNVLVIGSTLDLALLVLPAHLDLPARLGFAAAGIVLNGIATAAYIGVDFGAGPRDGLMTGLSRRTGHSLRAVRTCLEAAVVLAGWLLGGTLGVATIAYALSIGPLAQAFLHLLRVPKGPAK